MYKHQYNGKVVDGGKTYYPDKHGIVLLPKRFIQFNPIDEAKKVLKFEKKIKGVKHDKMD